MGVGKIFFAMVDDGDVFNPAIHCVEDYEVFRLAISQREGEFALASLDVLNPRQGLLDPSRKTRIFISCEKTPETPGDIVLLFSGHILAFPANTADEIITIQYIAQPEDWVDVQQNFVESLKVSPYYNPLFIAEENRNDTHEILSARSSLLHWNRATNAISLSDYIQGQEFIDLGGEFFEDTIQTDIGDPPINRVDLNIEAQWYQIGVGTVNVGEAIRQGFTNPITAQPEINTLTPKTFEQAWAGVNIPSGYTLVESNLYSVANSFGLTGSNLRSGNANVLGSSYLTSKGFALPGTRECNVPRVWYRGKLILLGEYRQKRREVASASIRSIVQDYSLQGENVEELNLRIQDPVAIVNGAVLHPSEPSFFLETALDQFSSYGEGAIEYGLLRARARLIKGARAVDVSFSAPVDGLLDISCDHSLRVSDERLPGENVRGKVSSYSLVFSDKDQFVSVTISCCIGTGEDVFYSPSTKAIEQVEYFTEPSQDEMETAISYKFDSENIPVPIDVQQMESDDQYLVDDLFLYNHGEQQNDGFMASSTPDLYLQNNKTAVYVNLKSMNPAPELSGEVEIFVDDFTLPAHIDLGGL